MDVAVAEAGGSTMSNYHDDYEPLFSLENIERWKRRELPAEWLQMQKEIFLARCRAQLDELNKILASADDETVKRLKRPL